MVKLNIFLSQLIKFVAEMKFVIPEQQCWYGHAEFFTELLVVLNKDPAQ